MTAGRPPSPVVDLTRVREARAAELLLAEVERELAAVRARLTALCTGGALFETGGGREGRRLLVAQEGLLLARRRLEEACGSGPLPAPRLPATRERLLAEAREVLARVRARLQVQEERASRPGRG